MSKLPNLSNFLSVVRSNLTWRKDGFYFIVGTIVTIVGDLLEPLNSVLHYTIGVSLVVVIILAFYIFHYTSKGSGRAPISLKTAVDSFVALMILLIISTTVYVLRKPESDRGFFADSFEIAREIQYQISPHLTKIEKGIEELSDKIDKQRQIEISTMPFSPESNAWEISVSGFEEMEGAITVYYLTKNGQQINITKHPAFLGFSQRIGSWALLSFDWRELDNIGFLDMRICYDKCTKTKDKRIKIDIEREISDYAKTLILKSSLAGLSQWGSKITWDTIAFRVCPQAFKKIEIVINGLGNPIEYPLTPLTKDEIKDGKIYKPFPSGGIDLPVNTKFIVVDIEFIDGSTLDGLRFSL